MKFLLRYGEIGLKGRHVRSQMKRRLRRNVLELFDEHAIEGTMTEEEGRLFVESDDVEAERLLSRVFGLVSFSRVWETDATLHAISKMAVQLVGRVQEGGSTFAVRVRRVGEHSFTSMDMARELGSAILDRFPDLTVNLTAPDWEVHVEVRGGAAYLYTDVLPGVGGLPLGTQGKVVTLVETPEGVLASWLMMKRGCRVLPVFREEGKWAAALQVWDPGIRWRAIETLDEMRGVAEKVGALGFVYPKTSPDSMEGDLRPAFYPLIGLGPAGLKSLRATVLGPT